MSTYSVPDSILSALHMVLHLILTTKLWGRSRYHPHFSWRKVRHRRGKSCPCHTAGGQQAWDSNLSNWLQSPQSVHTQSCCSASPLWPSRQLRQNKRVRSEGVEHVWWPILRKMGRIFTKEAVIWWPHASFNSEIKCEIPQTLLIKAITRMNITKQPGAWTKVSHRVHIEAGSAQQQRYH